MWYEFAKRAVDIIGAVILLILFFPIMVVTAILIRFTSPGPIFADTPKRVGLHGKQFFAYKFRSMIVNAHRLLKTHPRYKKLHDEYRKSSYKLFKDPRLTKVGRIIRKYSIDETPQFLNVIKGEMSIVGPRPYYVDELDIQQEKYPHTKKLVKEMLQVRPGITGFWQVSGRSEVNFDKRIEMDAYYARKKSILLDILILIKTPWAMISGKGAV